MADCKAEARFGRVVLWHENGRDALASFNADEAVRLSGELELAALRVRREAERQAAERDSIAPAGTAWRVEVQRTGAGWHRLPGEFRTTADAREVAGWIDRPTRLALCESVNRGEVAL